MSITVRAPDLPVPPGDRASHWLGGNLVASHVFNAAGTMIPPLERMVMRTAHRMAHLADDEALSRDVTALCRQEAQHGVAHSRFDRVLVEQGFDVSRPVARLEATMAAMERWCSPQLCLSFCVAVEHIFACMGDYVLTTDAMTGAEPGHAALWEWHGLEELEHKSVLFRLYERAGRGWLHRQAGMAIAASIFAVWLATFLVTLLRADPEYSLQRHRRDRRAWTDAGGQTAGRLLLRYVWPYLQPGFHPDQTDHRELLAEAQRRLEARGLAA